MEQLLEHVINVMLPVLICVLVGYGLAIVKAPFDNKTFGELTFNVGYPALVLSHLAKEHIQVNIFLTVLAAASGMILIFAVLGFAILSLLKIPIRAYWPPMMLSSVANIGVPVATLAFGPEGAAVAIGFMVVMVVAIFTLGMAIPMGRPDYKALAKQPVIYAVVLSLVLMINGWSLPTPVNQSLEILGGLAVPIMLLMLGYNMETLEISGVARACLVTLVHIAISAVAAFSLSQVLDLNSKIESIIILLCFMPPSVATYLAVSEHQPDHASGVAGFIFMSTIMILLTIPIVLTFWATG